MGYYGGTLQASMNGNPADFDLSGNVDLKDLLEITELWLEGVNLDIHDLDPDGLIDLKDFNLFSREWLWSY